MRKKTFFSMLPFVLILAFAVAAISAMSGANYSLRTSVLSSGGTTMDSANYQMTTTIGQSSAIGQSSKGSHINCAGFWQPSEFKIRAKSMPWIPLLLMDD